MEEACFLRPRGRSTSPSKVADEHSVGRSVGRAYQTTEGGVWNPSESRLVGAFPSDKVRCEGSGAGRAALDPVGGRGQDHHDESRQATGKAKHQGCCLVRHPAARGFRDFEIQHPLPNRRQKIGAFCVFRRDMSAKIKNGPLAGVFFEFGQELVSCERKKYENDPCQ